MRIDPNPGNADVFVTKLLGDGSGLVYSTYLRGDGYDTGNGIAVRDTGDLYDVYVVGTTRSSDFLTTPGSYQPNDLDPGNFDAFVTKLEGLQ